MLIKLAAWFGITTLAGCGGARARVGPGPNVSSESSDYSPTIQLTVSLTPLLSRPDSIVVLIDSGTVKAPGVQPPKTPAAMSNLYLTAFLATPTRSPVRDASTPPWAAVAESDSVHIADSLRLGETQRLPALRFAVPRPQPFDASVASLVFRITGKAATIEIRLADGRAIAAAAGGGKIRVYACADWTLDGFVLERRRKALRRAYNAAC